MNILQKVLKLETEASDFGFRWEIPQQIREQIVSEISEIEAHLKDHDRTKLQEEIGDLLHAVFSLTVFCGFDPEETLAMSVDKFEKRFNAVKRIAAERGLQTLQGMKFDALMEIWSVAKKS